jgi:hypothetical protein
VDLTMHSRGGGVYSWDDCEGCARGIAVEVLEAGKNILYDKILFTDHIE